MTIKEKFEADNCPRLQKFNTLMAAWQKQDETLYEIAEHDYLSYLDESRKLMDRLFEDEKDITLIYEGFDIDELHTMEFSGGVGRNVVLYILKPDWVDVKYSDFKGYLDSCAGLSRTITWRIITTRHPLDAIGFVEIVY